MDDIPANLYKYVPAARAIDILGKLLVRFSQVSVLNDALEFKPPLRGIFPQSSLENVLEESMKTAFDDVITRFQLEVPSHVTAKIQQEMFSIGAILADQAFAATEPRIYEELDKKVGILSLSETATNTLMWSHYADGGRGFLIEFDPKHSWFWSKRAVTDDFRHLRRVIYATDRPEKYLMDTTGDDILYTKSDAWEYEKEWRIIRSFDDATGNAGMDANGKDIQLFAVPTDCILSIVTGYRADRDSLAKLRDLVAKKPALSHVRFRVCILEKNGDLALESLG